MRAERKGATRGRRRLRVLAVWAVLAWVGAAAAQAAGAGGLAQDYQRDRQYNTWSK